jgi:hypothetical protein
MSQHPIPPPPDAATQGGMAIDIPGMIRPQSSTAGVTAKRGGYRPIGEFLSVDPETGETFKEYWGGPRGPGGAAKKPDPDWERGGIQVPPGSPSQAYLEQQVVGPTIPAGGRQTYTPLVEKPGEIIPTGTGEAPGVQYRTPEEIAAGIGQADVTQAVEAAQIDPDLAQAAAPTPVEEQQYDVTQIDQPIDIEPAEITAAQAGDIQGITTPESTVQFQLESLMQDVDDSKAPWAAAAMRKANSAMAQRGLLGSSIAGEAITQAIMEAALPIAQLDAQTFGQINMQNLQNRQQTMLSNTAAENAARHFNATSANEVNKFMAGMKVEVNKFNEVQRTAMEQFNITRAGDVAKFNVEIAQALEQYNASARLGVERTNVEQRNDMAKLFSQFADSTNKLNAVQELKSAISNAEQINAHNQLYDKMSNQAEQFNATNALTVAKSTAELRRTQNTANTAGQNAANMVNAMNTFNMSQQALANLWQRSRDIFQWANSASENDKDRAFKLTLYALKRKDYKDDLTHQENMDAVFNIADLALDIWDRFNPNNSE